MAFVKVNKARPGRYVKGKSVTLAVHLADSKIKYKSLSVRITRELIWELKWDMSEEARRVSLYEGTGDDVGFLQVLQDKDGYALTGKLNDPASSARGFSFNISMLQHYILNEPAPISSTQVQHIVEGTTLIIECPKWLVFNPQSVPEPAVAPQQTHVQPPPPPPSSVVPIHGKSKRKYAR